MSDPQASESEEVILVECPAFGDAEFYGQWLLCAAKVDALLQEAFRNDIKFRQVFDTLELFVGLQYGAEAMTLLTQLKEHPSFMIAADSEYSRGFVLMNWMGFFKLTGDRYQMTLPDDLTLKMVKEVHREYAETAADYEDGIQHPEQLVCSLPRSEAQRYQLALRNMNAERRLADRRALLFFDA